MIGCMQQPKHGACGLDGDNAGPGLVQLHSSCRVNSKPGPLGGAYGF